MINIYLNGEPTILEDNMTLGGLLKKEKAITGTFALAVNEVVINSINYDSVIIQPEDRIEIITAMCGG